MQVFISYSHKDTVFVNRLKQDLQAQNINIWIDYQGIEGGDTWRTSIIEGIKNSDAFLIVLSPGSVASRNVNKELSIADESNKHIVPIMAEQCELSDDMKYQLAGVQWVDFTGDKYSDGFVRLIRALNMPLKSVPVTPPQPATPQPATPQPNAPQPGYPASGGQQPFPSQPQQPAPGAWILGTWNMFFQNPLNGNSGSSQITFSPDGAFRAQWTSPMGFMQIDARWWFVNPEFISVQGNYTVAPAGYYGMPYVLGFQITGVWPTNFTGLSPQGDQINCQRVG